MIVENVCKLFELLNVILAFISGYPPTFQSGLSSAIPSYANSQQSSLYSDTTSSSGFTIPTTTVSSHSSTSAFHKPDESTNSSYSSHSSLSSLSNQSASHSLNLHSTNSHQDSSSGYSSSSSFSVPSSTPQQQVINSFHVLFYFFHFLRLHQSMKNIFYLNTKCQN